MKNFWIRFACERQNLFGASFLRAGLGMIMLTTYLMNLRSRSLIWGPNGQIDYTYYTHSSVGDLLALYRYEGADWYAALIYALSVLIAAMYVIGLWPRITCWLFAVTTYASIARDPLAFDAGATLLRVLSFYLCIVDSAQFVTLFRKPALRSSVPCNPALATMLHNAGIFIVAYQVCMVYFWSGFYKIAGKAWREGTALEMVLKVDHFAIHPQLSATLLQHERFIVAATYITLIVQIGFAYLMWIPRFKPIYYRSRCLAPRLHRGRYGLVLLLGHDDRRRSLVAFRCVLGASVYRPRRRPACAEATRPQRHERYACS